MAGTTHVIKAQGLEAIGFQQITSMAASTALTVPARAKAALVTITGQTARVRFDGSAPTAGVGHLVAVGDSFFIVGDLEKVRMIQTAATALADVSYFA